MFNIKSRIYVSFKDDIGFVIGDWADARVLYLYKGSEGDFDHVEKVGYDSTGPGVVACRKSYAEMVAKDFNGSDVQFYEWLETQDRLWIAVSESADYERLFANWLIEIEHTYGIEKAHIQDLLDAQRTKVYFSERPHLRDMEEALQIIRQVYKPTGLLLKDPRELPLETVLYLRYRGYVEKKIADSKMQNVSESMLRDFIRDAVRDVRNDLLVNQNVIRLWKDNQAINTVAKAMKTIDDDSFLRSMFFAVDSVNLHDSEVLKDVIRFCEICIDNEMDYPDEIPRHRGELDLYVKLFRTNDSDIFTQNITTMANAGFIQGRGAKFNPLLFMFLYADSVEPAGTFEVRSDGEDSWWWVFKNVDGEVLATSTPHKTEAKCREGIRYMKYHTNTAETL